MVGNRDDPCKDSPGCGQKDTLEGAAFFVTQLVVLTRKAKKRDALDARPHQKLEQPPETLFIDPSVRLKGSCHNRIDASEFYHFPPPGWSFSSIASVERQGWQTRSCEGLQGRPQFALAASQSRRHAFSSEATTA